jgi:hypothetical protein
VFLLASSTKNSTTSEVKMHPQLSIASKKAYIFAQMTVIFAVCSGASLIVECDTLGSVYINGMKIVEISNLVNTTSGAIEWNGIIYEGDSLTIMSTTSSNTMACAVIMSYIDINDSIVTVNSTAVSSDWKASRLTLSNATDQNIVAMTARGFLHCNWSNAVRPLTSNIALSQPVQSPFSSGRNVLRTIVGNMDAGCTPIKITGSGMIRFFINGNLTASGNATNIIHSISKTLQYGDVVAVSVEANTMSAYFTAMISTSLGFWDTNSAFLWRGSMASPDLLTQDMFASQDFPQACSWAMPVYNTSADSNSTLVNIGVTGIWPATTDMTSTTNVAIFRTVIGVGTGNRQCSSTPTCKVAVVKCK